MNRLVDGLAGSGWVTSIALVANAGLESDLVNWAIKAFLASSVAAIGYFLRDIAKTIKETKTQTEDNARAIQQHDTIINLWIESLGKEIENRHGHVGRRRTDQSMANLITAIRGVQGRTDEEI